jgi:hypothetical protein
MNTEQLNDIILNNEKRFVILKFTSYDCSICKNINLNFLNQYDVHVINIEIHNNPTLYKYFKRYKAVYAFPTFIIYDKENLNEQLYAPNHIVVGLNYNLIKNYII